MKGSENSTSVRSGRTEFVPHSRSTNFFITPSNLLPFEKFMTVLGTSFKELTFSVISVVDKFV